MCARRWFVKAIDDLLEGYVPASYVQTTDAVTSSTDAPDAPLSAGVSPLAEDPLAGAPITKTRVGRRQLQAIMALSPQPKALLALLPSEGAEAAPEPQPEPQLQARAKAEEEHEAAAVAAARKLHEAAICGDCEALELVLKPELHAVKLIHASRLSLAR